MHVLVAYGSKRGGTEGLAVMVGEAFEAEGATADVRPAREVGDLQGYDAVVVGGGLYTGHWHKDARRFVKRHSDVLWNLPVWCFSSGPLDDSAAQSEIPPVKDVASAIRRVGAEGHATFGGFLAPDAHGFPASAMAKRSAGDYRDPAQVRAWVKGIAEELRGRAGAPA